MHYVRTECTHIQIHVGYMHRVYTHPNIVYKQVHYECKSIEHTHIHIANVHRYANMYVHAEHAHTSICIQCTQVYYNLYVHAYGIHMHIRAYIGMLFAICIHVRIAYTLIQMYVGALQHAYTCAVYTYAHVYNVHQYTNV